MPLSYRQLTRPAIEPVTLSQAKQHLRVDAPDDDLYISALIVAARQQVEQMTNRAIFNRTVLLTLDYFPFPGWGGTTGSTANDYFMHWYYRGLSIRLPLPSSVSVQSLTYIATDGVTVLTIDPANYVVDVTSEPARISPAPGYTWPYQQNYIPGQVKVTYTAGTYELAVSETFTVPTSPYVYTLQQSSSLITFMAVKDGSGNPVACTNAAGVLTFDPTKAGQTLTASYTVNNCPQTIVWAMLLLIGHFYENRSAATSEAIKQIPLCVAELLAPETFDTFDW